MWMGGNLAKYFPLSPQLDFPSSSLHSIFKYCSLRQIVFCQLDLGNSQTHGAKCKWGTFDIIQWKHLANVKRTVIYHSSYVITNSKLRLRNRCHATDRIKSFPRGLKMKAEHWEELRTQSSEHQLILLWKEVLISSFCFEKRFIAVHPVHWASCSVKRSKLMQDQAWQSWDAKHPNSRIAIVSPQISARITDLFSNSALFCLSVQ